MRDSRALSKQIAEVARSLEHETGAQATMDLVVRMAVETVPHAEDAALTIAVKGHGPETQAATSDLTRRVDEIQLELGEGPCISAIFDEELISVPNYTTGTRVGALNLFATAPHAFDGEDVEAGTLVAVHAAIAIAAAQKLEHAVIGLDSRSTIGQAQGILMERFDLDPARAFDVLRRISSHSNRKIYDLASELVQTREVPSSTST
jgi:GAF domain-containing protein